MNFYNFINNDINNKINIEYETVDNFDISNHNYDHLFKILLLGDSNVGKSSLIFDILNYKNKESEIKTLENTLGVDFHFKELIVDNREIKIQIWDTAGQERFRSITSSYYKTAHGILLIFDLNNHTTLNNINTWMNELNQFIDIKKLPIILIGNKSDLKRNINNNILNDIINKYKFPYFETKYLNNSIDYSFEYLIKSIFNKLLNDEKEGNSTMWAHNNLTLNKLNKNTNSNHNCCIII
tara:strand:+ start:2892 stop:3608 length:717 start_codon:yes stop_codon:yes gene_type:complete